MSRRAVILQLMAAERSTARSIAQSIAARIERVAKLALGIDVKQFRRAFAASGGILRAATPYMCAA